MTSTDWKEIADVARQCGHAHAPSQVAFTEFAAQCEKRAVVVELPAAPVVEEPEIKPAAPVVVPPAPAAAKVEPPKTEPVKAN